MPFEDLLKPTLQCKTCTFIAGLNENLRREVVAALGKAKYSDEALARAMRSIAVDPERVPGRMSVKKHRADQHGVVDE